MRVHHEARGGRVTERFAVELEPHEAEAIADMYLSLFKGKTDPIATGLAKIEREFGLDGQLALRSADSVETMACPTENAPASRERSGAEPRGVSS